MIRGWHEDVLFCLVLLVVPLSPDMKWRRQFAQRPMPSSSRILLILEDGEEVAGRRYCFYI